MRQGHRRVPGTCRRAVLQQPAGHCIELSGIRQDGDDPRAVSGRRLRRYSRPRDRRGAGAAVVGYLHYPERRRRFADHRIAAARARHAGRLHAHGRHGDQSCHQSDDEDQARLRSAQGLRPGLADDGRAAISDREPEVSCQHHRRIDRREQEESRQVHLWVSRSWHLAAHRGRADGASRRHLDAPRSVHRRCACVPRCDGRTYRHDCSLRR